MDASLPCAHKGRVVDEIEECLSLVCIPQRTPLPSACTSLPHWYKTWPHLNSPLPLNSESMWPLLVPEVCLSVVSACIYVHTWCPQRPEKVLDPL